MTEGKTYDIQQRDREFVMLGRRSILIGHRVPPDSPYFDRVDTLALIHVLRLEQLAVPQPPRS